MGSYYNKKDYLDLCKNQVNGIGQVIKSLEYIKDSLPESESQFNARQIDRLNKGLVQFGCICDLRKDWCNKDNAFLLIQTIDRSTSPYNSAEIGHGYEKRWFGHGKIHDTELIREEICNKIAKYRLCQSRYAEASSKIDKFLESYERLVEAWDEVVAYKLPDIHIDSVNRNPPII